MQRRDFLRFSALGAAAATLAPVSGMGMTPTPKKNVSKNDKLRMGFIGLGQQAMYLLNGFMSMDDVRVVAGCDVYDIKRDRFVRRVKDYYTGKGEKKVKVDVYEDYQDLLARPDIDAVVIATPDHQHAVIAIAACKAGKDVYLEKPATLTVYEGQQLVKAVRKYNRILQMGSQQ
ncbi:MAG: Gfo/Idh/MocA family oxidoreductase, partial [Bacteroidales bacterium]|nr:Gfo/Idh/MocA family oxidoreductase [Bacteroidales bacterium]